MDEETKNIILKGWIAGSVVKDLFFGLYIASKEISPTDQFPAVSFERLALKILTKHPEPLVAKWLRDCVHKEFGGQP